MKFFDKKLSIIFIGLLIIACIALYFFTKDEESTFISTNELYVTEEVEENESEEEEIIVHIDGEVLNPGIVHLPTGARITDAIEAAGGTTELTNISIINLAYELQDGQKIYIPSIYDSKEITYIQNDAGNNVLDESSSGSQSLLININTATQAELETLPGIGSATATKVIDYRTKNGKFKKIEDIMNVSGIGEAKFNNIKDYICI